jgi:hypothetical protein
VDTQEGATAGSGRGTELVGTFDSAGPARDAGTRCQRGGCSFGNAQRAHCPLGRRCVGRQVVVVVRDPFAAKRRAGQRGAFVARASSGRCTSARAAGSTGRGRADRHQSLVSP